MTAAEIVIIGGAEVSAQARGSQWPALRVMFGPEEDP